MDEAGGYFLYGEDRGSFMGNGADLFYSAGTSSSYVLYVRGR